MEAQESSMKHQQNNVVNLYNASDNQILIIINNAYKSKEQKLRKESERYLMQNLQYPEFNLRLIQLMNHQSQNRLSLRIQISILIQRSSQKIKYNQTQAMNMIDLLLNIMFTKELDSKIKQTISIAINNILQNHNNNRKLLYNKIINHIQTYSNPQFLESYSMICSIFIIQNQITPKNITFANSSIQLLAKIAINIYRQIQTMEKSQWRQRLKLMLPQIQAFFQMVQKIIQCIQQNINNEGSLNYLRTNNHLIEAFELYLMIYNTQTSLVSSQFQILNDVKVIITNCATLLYLKHTCPINIFRIYFCTLLNQNKKIVNDIVIQKILVNCLKLLNDHLKRRVYPQFISDDITQVVFSLLLFSVTNTQQFELMQDDPQKFIQIAQDYCNDEIQSQYLKVQAGCMLKTIIKVNDQALINMVQIITIMLCQILNPQFVKYNQKFIHFKSSISEYQFTNQNSITRMQTLLMVISTLSQFVHKRHDLQTKIYQFFSSSAQQFLKFNDQIVILRFMRAISYYPSGYYYYYLQLQVIKGQIYMLQGIKSFVKIIKKTKNSELLSVIGKIIPQMVINSNITDVFLKQIINKKMMLNNMQLLKAFLNKITTSFCNDYEKNEHKAQTALNLLYQLVKYVPMGIQNKLVQNQICSITQYLYRSNNKEWQKYQYKIVQLYDLMLRKYNTITSQVAQFVNHSFKYISNQSKGSPYFRFYNKYIQLLSSNLFNMQIWLQKCWEQFKNIIQLKNQSKQSIQSIPYYALFISQICFLTPNIQLIQNMVIELLNVLQNIQESKKQYILFIIYSIIYIRPQQFRQFALNKSIYQQFLISTLKIKYENKIILKIRNLYIIQLIGIQKQPKILQALINYLIQYLRQSKPIQKQFNKTIQPIIPKIRSIESPAQHFQPQIQGNQLVQIYCGYIHPADNIDQMVFLKTTIDSIKNILVHLSQQTKYKLSLLLQIQLIHNSTRRIIKVIK